MKMIRFLSVCGTTGKKKACKDCSCGLAEELATEKGNTSKPVENGIQKSSCGSVSYRTEIVKSLSHYQ